MLDVPEFAKAFYVCHISEGLVNYPEVGKMRLLREETLRKMDPTFSGKPVKYDREHLNAGDTAQINQAKHKGAYVDGVVDRSFFNEHDGRHWAKVWVWDENALDMIKQGIGVSNAYFMDSKGQGGEYHATPFDEEVMDGTYDHLLITASPRYEESMKIGFLTPDQFDEYNKSRAEKLALVKNSKEQDMSLDILKVFNRTEAKDFDLAGKEVFLPKSKKTVLITNVLNAVDEEMKKEEDGEAMANMSHKVKVGNATMPLSELMDCYNREHEENMRLKNEVEEWEKAADGKAHNSAETEEEKKKREEEEEKSKNAKEESEKEKEKEKAENAKRIQNKIQRLKTGPQRAEHRQFVGNSTVGNTAEFEQPVLRFKEDAVADGLAHYGGEEE